MINKLYNKLAPKMLDRSDSLLATNSKLHKSCVYIEQIGLVIASIGILVDVFTSIPLPQTFINTEVDKK